MKKKILSSIIISTLFGQVDYSSQIQPIFDNNCTSCHIDGGAYYGGLDLSSYILVMEGGNSGNTIVSYEHTDSELYQRITLYESDDQFMPQNGSPLPQSDIDLIAQWIDEGALEVASDSTSIEGRWISEYYANTMYEFDGDVRLTYYCIDDVCDSTYWNSLDTGDALPTQNPYTFINDTLTIDLHFGNYFVEVVTFLCDGNVIDFNSQQSNLFRIGTDFEDCEDYNGQQLGLSNIMNTPEKFRLNQNYPNPFNPVTTLQYDLPEDGFINITIYDMMGKVIKNLVRSHQRAGYKSVQWNATNNESKSVSAGLYLYKIQVGDFRQVKKMILLK
tara:strand:- start:377 stop:1369 length:993 start_codon:yes stop_codon:yes gene_type:complete